jgi:hypothetical protein
MIGPTDLLHPSPTPHYIKLLYSGATIIAVSKEIK